MVITDNHERAHAWRIAAVRHLTNVVRDGQPHVSTDEYDRAYLALKAMTGTLPRWAVIVCLLCFGCASPTAPTMPLDRAPHVRTFPSLTQVLP